MYGNYSFPKKEIPTYMTDYFYEWLKLWDWYKKGVWPHNCSLMDMPWKIVRVFEVFDNILSEKKNKGK